MKLLFVLLMLFAVGCEKPDDIKQIRGVVDDLAGRAKAHDLNGLFGHTSSGFKANPGSRDAQDVRPILLLALRSYGKFTIEYPVPGIRLDADAGTADVSVPFLIVREGQQLPTADLAEIAADPVAWGAKVAELAGDPYQLDLEMKRTEDGWKITRSTLGGFKRLEDL